MESYPHVQNLTRHLRAHERHVYTHVRRARERRANRPLGNLRKHHPWRAPHRQAVHVAHVPRDRLALAVAVRRQIYGGRAAYIPAQRIDGSLLLGHLVKCHSRRQRRARINRDDDVVQRLEATHVPVRRDASNRRAQRAQESLYLSALGGRFHYHQRRPFHEDHRDERKKKERRDTRQRSEPRVAQ